MPAPNATGGGKSISVRFAFIGRQRSVIFA